MEFKIATSNRNAGTFLPILLALALLLLGPLLLLAAGPRWWSDSSVLDPNPTLDDDAPLPFDLLKNLVLQGYLELQAELPPSIWTNASASNLTAFAIGFSKTNAAPASVNRRQLRYAARQFYDFFITNGYVTNYPWAGITNGPPETATATIDQAKSVFAFDPTTFHAPPPNSKEPPAAPENFTTDYSTPGEIHLRWSPSPTATSYELRSSLDQGATWTVFAVIDATNCQVEAGGHFINYTITNRPPEIVFTIPKSTNAPAVADRDKK
jgi:hypothetical protein